MIFKSQESKVELLRSFSNAQIVISFIQNDTVYRIDPAGRSTRPLMAIAKLQEVKKGLGQYVAKMQEAF